jgi:serine/threonine protein kinase
VDIVSTDNGPALVLPIARGGDLFDLVNNQGALPESSVKTITLRMLSALAYLHQRRIVHRDVKLENILLMSEDVGDTVLCDFGFAVELREGEFGEQLCGSPAYTAPEIWQKLRYSEKVDIWSLGVSMFVMLAGEFPYVVERGRLAVECIKAGVQDLVNNPGLDGVSLSCRQLLWEMLRIDPAARISAVDALNHAWFCSPGTNAGFAAEGIVSSIVADDMTTGRLTNYVA